MHGNGNWPVEMGGNGNTDCVPAHLYSDSELSHSTDRQCGTVCSVPKTNLFEQWISDEHHRRHRCGTLLRLWHCQMSNVMNDLTYVFSFSVYYRSPQITYSAQRLDSFNQSINWFICMAVQKLDWSMHTTRTVMQLCLYGVLNSAGYSHRRGEDFRCGGVLYSIFILKPYCLFNHRPKYACYPPN